METTYLLALSGVAADLKVVRVEVFERVHEPYRAVVTFAAFEGTERATIALDDVIGQKAELTFQHADEPRVFHAMVDSIEQVGMDHVVVLAPKLATLRDRVDYRVFVDQDPLAAAKVVLSDAGLSSDVRVREVPAKRPQIVQAFESDLAFVQRLLAEEGIALRVETGGDDVVVLADDASGATPLPGGDELVYGRGDEGGLDASEEAVYALRLDRRAVVGHVTLRDYDFERPLLDQTVEAGEGALEHFEFPAGYLDPGAGKRLAGRRLEEFQRGGQVLRARSSCRRLHVGGTFTVDGAPREDLAGPWVIVALTHRGADFTGEGPARAEGGKRTYEAELVAEPADIAVRPRRHAIPRKPTSGGFEHATVTGPGGDLHTEQHGRVKALLRWDRRGKADDSSSTWLRTMQPATSGGFFLPRVGWEVLLATWGRSTDQPFEIGRLYNGIERPPEDLPGKKIRGNFGTLTTPGGGSANLLRIDDTAGTECILLDASKDLNERTENDKGSSVQIDDVVDVGVDRKEIVGVRKDLTVTAPQSTSVGASRDWSMTGALKLKAGSEKILVGGLRLVQVGGDYETQAATMTRIVIGAKAEVAIQEINRHVTGATAITTGGAWNEVGGLASSESILGSKTLLVGAKISIKAKDYSLTASRLKETYASKTIQAGGKRVESYKGSAKYKLAKLGMKGAKVHVKAKNKIVLIGSGAKITITKNKIVVDAALDVSGVSVLSGSYEAK